MKKSLVLFSGGIDSTIALYWAIQQKREVHALSFHYPDRPEGERLAAERIRSLLGVFYQDVSLPFLHPLKGVISSDVKETSPKLGYVPMRNLVFYAVAGYYGEILNVEEIIGGHTKEDARVFSDARTGFFRLVEQAYARSLKKSFSASGKTISIVLPFARLSEQEEMRLATRLGVPFSLTWSCWRDGPAPCGSCFACIQRKQALSHLTSAR